VEASGARINTVRIAVRALVDLGELVRRNRSGSGPSLYTTPSKRHLLPEMPAAVVAEALRQAGGKFMTTSEIMEKTGFGRWVTLKAIESIDDIERIDRRPANRSEHRYFFRWIGDRRKAA
jgi:hypothetical protein